MARIPLLDVRSTWTELQGELQSAYSRVMASGRYILGPECQAFEQEFAKSCGADHAIGVGNGLDALVLGLKALGIGPGDEVLVPGNTFIASWLAITQVGARPVPVEPEEGTHNMDAAAATASVTPHTRAIMPVHLYGQPADLDGLQDLCRRRKLVLVEDAAQAHGALHRGRPVGAIGDLGGYSFYPGKNLGAFGDGGAVVTNDERLADKLRTLRNYGSVIRYKHDVAGVNSRLDELQAAFLRAKLRRLPAWNERRRAIAARYQQEFASLAGVVEVPRVPAWATPVWHIYAVRCSKRDQLQAALAERGVDTGIHYPVPPHLQGAYPEHAGASLPVTTRLARQVLSLPIGPHMNDPEVARVTGAVREAAQALEA